MKLRIKNLYASVFIAFLILAIGGTGTEDNMGIVGYFIKSSFEETSDILVNVVKSSTQLADINSFAATPHIDDGQGGPENTVELQLVQENSMLSFMPPVNDYLDNLGIKRNGIVEYTVQEGDLLSFIASDYGVSVNSLLWANNLKNADSISLGQVIKIPPVSGVIHKVKSGDTLASIAKKYGAEQDAVLEFNGLPLDGHLVINDEIIVPDGQLRGTVTAPASTGSKRFSYLPDLGDYFMKPTTGILTRGGAIHGRNGIDIANRLRTPIYAAADGIITAADSVGYNGGYGQYIKISHPNGTETLYGHASKLLVVTGQTVIKGQEIALMGSTGQSTGSHLHFEVHGAKNPLSKY